MKFNNILGTLHRFLGKSRLFHGLFLKLRNQVSAVIAHGLNDGIDMQTNGQAWLVEQIAPDARFFIDVGANKGAWTAAFTKRARADVCGLMFEPSAEAAQHLVSHIVGQVGLAQVELVKAAVSDRRGNLIFYEEPDCGETSSLVKAHSFERAVARSVEVTTLDDEIEQRLITHVDMLKIDTEGYDLHVIKGARRSIKLGLIDVVQFEYNSPWALANSTLCEALDIFRENQYSVFLLLARGLVQFDYDIYGEFYHYSNFVALSPRAIHRFIGVVPP